MPINIKSIAKAWFSCIPGVWLRKILVYNIPSVRKTLKIHKVSILQVDTRGTERRSQGEKPQNSPKLTWVKSCFGKNPASCKAITKLWNNPCAHEKAQKLFQIRLSTAAPLHYWWVGVINQRVPGDEEHQCVTGLLKNHWSGDSSTAIAVGEKGAGALGIHGGFY